MEELSEVAGVSGQTIRPWPSSWASPGPNTSMPSTPSTVAVVPAATGAPSQAALS